MKKGQKLNLVAAREKIMKKLGAQAAAFLKTETLYMTDLALQRQAMNDAYGEEIVDLVLGHTSTTKAKVENVELVPLPKRRGRKPGKKRGRKPGTRNRPKEQPSADGPRSPQLTSHELAPHLEEVLGSLKGQEFSSRTVSDVLVAKGLKFEPSLVSLILRRDESLRVVGTEKTPGRQGRGLNVFTHKDPSASRASGTGSGDGNTPSEPGNNGNTDQISTDGADKGQPAAANV